VHDQPDGRRAPLSKVDELLKIGAEEAGGKAAATVVATDNDGTPMKIGLAVADDIGGGWTNRFSTDYTARFRIENGVRRGWISVILWASEPYDQARIHRETQFSVRRCLYVKQHGEAQTLHEHIEQELAAAS
jgi:hypothetical protein